MGIKRRSRSTSRSTHIGKNVIARCRFPLGKNVCRCHKEPSGKMKSVKRIVCIRAKSLYSMVKTQATSESAQERLPPLIIDS